ncbi:kunitz-like toxin PcKuz1 [Tubulanus polymorphus]|uniref:kunitz-like toxin PcKuz1 n=1 Tax=Tubulanus polymorphus TaxID=672921 RepID=UPI003DA471F9
MAKLFFLALALFMIAYETQAFSEICNQPMKVGPCKAAFQRFYFNKAHGQCEQFIYGGCQANENNFETMAACHSKCM